MTHFPLICIPRAKSKVCLVFFFCLLYFKFRVQKIKINLGKNRSNFYLATLPFLNCILRALARGVISLIHQYSVCGLEVCLLYCDAFNIPFGKKKWWRKWLWHECIVVDSSKVGSNDDSNYSFLLVSLSQSISGLGPSKVGLSLNIRWLLLQMKIWDFLFFMQIIIKIYQGKMHILNLKIADW